MGNNGVCAIGVYRNISCAGSLDIRSAYSGWVTRACTWLATAASFEGCTYAVDDSNVLQCLEALAQRRVIFVGGDLFVGADHKHALVSFKMAIAMTIGASSRALAAMRMTRMDSSIRCCRNVPIVSGSIRWCGPF